MGAVLVLLVALTAVGVAPGASAQVPQPGADSFFDAVRDCPPEVPLLVAVLTDEADEMRLDPLADLLARLGELERDRTEVLVATALPDYRQVAPWERAGPGSASRLAGFLDNAVPELDGEDDPTALSLLAGLAGVTADLDDRADELEADSAPACRLALVVSSGRVEVAERDQVCAPGGPVDQLARRSTPVWITSPAPVDDEGSAAVDLLSAVATGTDCGAEPLSARHLASTDPRMLALDIAHLVGALRDALVTADDVVACPGGPCDEGTHVVPLDPVLGRFSITVILPTDTAGLVVELPRGVQIPVEDRVGGPVAGGSFTMQTRWITPEVVRLEAEVTPGQTDWPGQWTLIVVDSEPGEDPGEGSEQPVAQVVVATESGVSARVAGTPQLVSGRAVNLVAEVVDREGRLVDAETLDGLVTVTARVLDAGGDEIVASTLAPTETGAWRGTVELPADVAGLDDAETGLDLVLSSGSALGDLPDLVTTTPVSVLGADQWPTVDSATSVLRGDAGGTGSGTLAVTAGSDVDGCVWLDAAALGTGGADAGLVLGDGARSSASCAVIPAGETVDVAFLVDLGDLSPGRFLGEATIAVGVRGAETFDLVEVEVVIEAMTPIDTLRRALIAAAMTLIALALPLVAIWLFDWAKARFRPSRRAVAVDVWIAVWSDGSIYRVDTDGSPLILSDDLCEPAELPRGRRFEWRGLQFAVRNATSPLSPPVATVGAVDAPVVASGGAIVDEDTVVGRVPMHLGGTWIFVLQPEATREAANDPKAPDFFASYGRLVVIRASMDDRPVDLAGLPRMAQRLARTVRSARTDGVDGTAQEMLDFVEANVSTPRDVPRMQSHEAHGGDSDAVHRSLPHSDEPYDFASLGELFDSDDEARDGAIAPEPTPSDLVEGSEPPGDDAGARYEAVEDEFATVDGEEGEDESSGVDIGFGIVFEDHLNPSAFLDDEVAAIDPSASEPPPPVERDRTEGHEPVADLAGDDPGAADEADDVGGEDDFGGADDAGSDDESEDQANLGWARRSRPNWPVPGRKKDR